MSITDKSFLRIVEKLHCTNAYHSLRILFVERYAGRTICNIAEQIVGRTIFGVTVRKICGVTVRTKCGVTMSTK